MNNTIIYLIGHYGVGKLTIARAIAAATGGRVFDNHLANNVIFSLIREDGKTKIPERAWDLIMTIRRQALVAMTELARPDASFILTNALMDADPMDRAAFSEVQAVAEQRRACFVPVTLVASDDAYDIRIPSPEREQRLKMTDAVGARKVRTTSQLLRVLHSHHLTIDTTDIAPDQAARMIIDHAERLA